MAFSWQRNIKRTKIKLLQRTQSLARSNSDFRIVHPELVRELESGNTDIEMKKYVDDKIKKRLKYGQVPKPSVIIKRLNRVG